VTLENSPSKVAAAVQPLSHLAMLANAALIEKRRLLCLEAEWRKRGARISSFIVVSEPMSFTAVVRDEAKLLVLIAAVDGTPLLPTAEFRIGCCPSESSRGEDIAGLIHERYGRCRISSSVRRLMLKDPAPPQGSGAVGDQRRDTISTVAG
jgi:hypothetical protein